MPNLQILYVENKSYAREYMRQLARNNDFGFQVASCCRQAVKALQKWHFDLVLMNIENSVTESFQTTQFIRRNIPKAAKLPIIFISSVADPQQAARSLLFGANSVLKMPISEDAFLAEIEILIP